MTPRKTCATCGRTLSRQNKTGLCRSHAMKALNADPEFAAANRERSRERMKALNADPEFAAANRERSRERMKALHADPRHNPLASLTPSERADYDILKRAGYTRDDALRAIKKTSGASA